MSDDAAPGRGGRRARRPRVEPTPAQRALALLTRREHSRRELERKLAARGVGPEDARATVERLGDAGWQDDGRFAETLVRSRAAAGHGPVRIRAELGMHGVDAALAAEALAPYEDEWTRIARSLVARRYGAAASDDPALRRKAAGLLFRRGFTGDQVRAATRFDPED